MKENATLKKKKQQQKLCILQFTIINIIHKTK